MEKAVAIGIEDYKEIIDKEYYYVDKTLFIKELLTQKGKVNLFTRPRRFGKTLALSMIKVYFEAELDQEGNQIDNSRYFNGTKIMKEGEAYTRHIGCYPVISLSLKAAKQADFRMAYTMVKRQIMQEYDRHKYVLSCDAINGEQKRRYQDIMFGEEEESLYLDSLKFLSDCLKKYHKQNVIILLDEYDVPLENAYLNEFYGEMITFIRSLFESALKTNDSLEFAVITGCLRISKESIFTGLNNLEIISILEDNYAEYFGFTEKEVEGMLRDYGIMEHLDTVRQWYDGYLFGDTEVYNPWSVLSYVKTAVSSKKAFPKAYWSNTSSNSIVRKLIERADAGVRTEIEALIAGGSIRKPMHEEITYEDMDTSQENLWNFLFFTGYLKVVGQHFEINTIYVDLAIPNEEIRYIYQNTIREWFNQKMEQTDFKGFYQDILSGNAEGMEDFISEQLAGSISYYDRAESFYHGYLLGVLSGIHGYKILSNRENGKGRPDIVLKPFHPKKPAVIFELKYAKKFTGMKKLCNEALEQIEKKEYARGLLDEGYTKILKYGICFCEKSCMIKCGDTAM